MSATGKPKKVSKKKKEEEGVTHPKRDNFICELDEQAVTVDNNGKIYEFSMDARSFCVEDIKVKITETAIILEGFHETDEEIIEINEEIDIPDQVLPSTIEVLMNENGVLRIRAPIQPKEAEMRTVIVREETRTEKITKKTVIRTYDCDMEVKVIRLSPAEGNKILADTKYEDSTKDLVTKDGKLELNIDLKGHRLEDIKVSVSDKVLAVQALAHYEIENPPKEIHRKYLIPDGIDPCSFRSLLKKNGTLLTEAEPKAPEPKPKAATPPPPPPKIPVVPPSAANEPITYCWIKSQIVEDPKEIEELTAKCEDITAEVAKVDNKKFEAQVNVADFKAEELRLKITKDFVLIHSETRTPKRQFHKKILLPAGVQPQSVKNKMTPKYALLAITAKITA